jgi:uncharacterized membrane protein YgcG
VNKMKKAYLILTMAVMLVVVGAVMDGNSNSASAQDNSSDRIVTSVDNGAIIEVASVAPASVEEMKERKRRRDGSGGGTGNGGSGGKRGGKGGGKGGGRRDGSGGGCR